jgi:hypothetical protein
MAPRRIAATAAHLRGRVGPPRPKVHEVRTSTRARARGGAKGAAATARTRMARGVLPYACDRLGLGCAREPHRRVYDSKGRA